MNQFMDENYQRNQAATAIRKEFEEALRKHVRRLAGISHEFSNILMSLDLLTLSITVLIVEREKEIHVQKEDPPKRYTEDSLLYDLMGLGLDDRKKVRLCLQVLLQKKYINDTKEGLAATEPAIKLTIFFDTIFPNMPGLNLVAYFNQIGDEILSKRKTIELALAQINKTLQVQGVSQIKKDKSKPQGRKNLKKKIGPSAQAGKSMKKQPVQKKKNVTRKISNPQQKTQVSQKKPIKKGK